MSGDHSNERIKADGRERTETVDISIGTTAPVPWQPTKAFNEFWRFASERHQMFESRLRGEPAPRSTCPVLSSRKFCNTFRILDRTSQYLLRHVIYEPGAGQDPIEVTFRVAVVDIGSPGKNLGWAFDEPNSSSTAPNAEVRGNILAVVQQYDIIKDSAVRGAMIGNSKMLSTVGFLRPGETRRAGRVEPNF